MCAHVWNLLPFFLAHSPAALVSLLHHECATCAAASGPLPFQPWSPECSSTGTFSCSHLLITSPRGCTDQNRPQRHGAPCSSRLLCFSLWPLRARDMLYVSFLLLSVSSTTTASAGQVFLSVALLAVSPASITVPSTWWAHNKYVLNSHRHTHSPVVRSTSCGFKSLKNTETIDHEAPVHHFRAPIPGKEASVPSVPAHWILLGRRSFSVFYTRQVSL